MKVRPAWPRWQAALLALCAPVSAQSNHLSEALRELPLQGERVRLEKLLDADTGVVTTRAVRSDGMPLSPNELAALEQQELALTPASAKLHPELVARLASHPGERQRVAIWLAFNPPSRNAARERLEALRAGGLDLEEARRVAGDELAARNAPDVAAARAALSQLGIEVSSASRLAPVVFCEITAEDADALALLSEVARVAPEREHADLGSEENGVLTARWHRVHDFGVRGDGIRVAICENNGITNAAGTKLNVVGYHEPLINVDDHASGTAGIVGSTDVLLPGYARGIELLSANASDVFGAASYADADIIEAIDWAVGEGADVVNMSFGASTGTTLDTLDMYVDYVSRYSAVSMVAAAGNSASTVSTPAKAWNAVSVGSIGDNINGDWDDDSMSSFSNFGDPDSSHGDRNKPELCSVGESFEMIGASGIYDYEGSGTSMAAPTVSGMIAALMQEGGPGDALRNWPEGAKAVLMAAARHDVDTSSDDKDGVGALNGLMAYRIVEGEQFERGTFTSSSFSSDGYYTKAIHLEAGDRARVVLSWGSAANSTYTSDTLEADLDLAVLAGIGTTSGTVLASSLSWDNNYEVCEFTPVSTGWYTVRVNDYRFDGSSEFYGLAWSQSYDGAYTRFRPYYQLDTAAGDTVGSTIGYTFPMRAVDTVNTGSTVVAYGGLSAKPGVQLAGDRLSHVSADFLTPLTLSLDTVFQNFSGTLNSLGILDTQIAIPDDPSFVGLPLYFAHATLDASHPGGIKEISRNERVVLWDHATELTLADDSSIPVSLGMSFPFYGVNYSGAHVNANGTLSFGGPSPDATESTLEFLTGRPRIAPFWCNLNPSSGGKVRYRHCGNQFVLEFVDVPEAGETNGQSVILILEANGRIEMKYTWVDLDAAVVGITPGMDGCTSDGEVDLSHGLIDSVAGAALFEHFEHSGDAFDLDQADWHRSSLRFEPIDGASCVTYRATFDTNGL